MKKVLREPLVHFLALGALLFALFAWRGGGQASSRIVVTEGQLQHLVAGFTRTRQRPPDEAELKGLVDEYVKEEIATREALAAGLDRDDPVVRKRLRQKLEFLTEDGADPSPPAEEELRSWLAAHPGRFGAGPAVALRQVFVSRERRGSSARGEVDRILGRLRAAGPDAGLEGLGDPTSLPAELPLGPAREVELTFGEAFAGAVAGAPAGRWIGPVESTYGLHAVLVRERVAGGEPDLAAVRPQVEREVLAERRRRALDALYDGLLARYSVRVEWPGTHAPAGAEARR